MTPDTSGEVCVITAGPSAGKSSTIRALAARGYRTLPEAARILFDQRISEGDDPEDVRQEPDFHEQVETIDRRIEQHIPVTESVFLDRSLADNLAYREHFGNDDCPEYDAVHRDVIDRYDYAFILDRLTFTDDAVRSEDEREARTIHRRILEAYEALNCTVYKVPVIPIDQRVDYILDRVE